MSNLIDHTPNEDIKKKALGLFNFIKQLVETKYKVVLDYRNQEWFYDLQNIHSDPEHISISDYLPTEEHDTNFVILEVKKPTFESPPEPDKKVLEWLDSDYKNFKDDLRIKEKRIDENGNDIHIHQFDGLAEKLDSYIKHHRNWAKKQRTTNRTKRLYDELFSRKSDLDNNSETLEMIVGNGLIESESAGNFIMHPFITKKVDIVFNMKNNSIQVIDTYSDPDIYTPLFTSFSENDVSIEGIKQYTDIMHNNPIHPLDMDSISDYMRGFVQRLSSDARYIKDANEKASFADKVIIRPCPMLIMRKRLDGTLKFIQQIIDDITDNEGFLAPPLLPIIGKPIPNNENDVEPTFEQQLASLNGESLEILLPKPANKEQLEIAERIQNETAVVVQGPPGTGKTHTIANILGHFLSEGKSILVTSQKSKALRVLKDKLPNKIKGLCVPLFDDGMSEVEKSVEKISEYSARTNSRVLQKKIKITSKAREEIIELLNQKRELLFQIKFKEFEPIVYQGQRYKPINMAKEVHENLEKLGVIPGPVDHDSPFPLPIEDLQRLYASNSKITIDEENALELDIPNPDSLGFASVDEFRSLLKNQADLKNQIIVISKKYNEKISDIENKESEINFDYIEKQIVNKQTGSILAKVQDREKHSVLKNTLMGFETLESYQLQAACDGKIGGGHKEKWHMLINAIEDTYNYYNNTVSYLFDKIFSNYDMEENSLIEELQKLQKIFGSSDKLSIVSFLGKRKLKSIYDTLKINEKKISSKNDCEIFIKHLTLVSKRKRLATIWESLMATETGISFEELGDTPEMIAHNYVEKLKRFLNWYRSEYRALLQVIDDNGINTYEMFQFSDNLFVTDKLKKTIEKIRTEVCRISELIGVYFNIEDILNQKSFEIDSINQKIKNTQEEITYKKKKAIDILSQGQRLSYNLCKDMLESINKNDADSFEKNYVDLRILCEKYEFKEFRKNSLHKISKVAPLWAEHIKYHRDIHGETTIPENILDAWKYKQFAGILDRISQEPFESLQKEVSQLSKKLREITEQLVAEKAWFHILKRIEEQLSLRQNLMGWLQIVKKIGKGTGKNAAMYKRKARENMIECQKAVPAWIMPVSKVMDNYTPGINKFDVIIIDEASQSDISALGLFYIAEKVIVVGDDKQVSPSAVGMEVSKINQLRLLHLDGKVPQASIYDGKTSIYDIAKTAFQPLMLIEHFRCVPDIINYSNKLAYNWKIKTLRDTNGVATTPALVNYSINGIRDGKRNRIEAETIVALIKACLELPEYQNKTFGVITLLGGNNDQVRLINDLVNQHIDVAIIEKIDFRCGVPSDFQGDERDIILLSMVDSNLEDGPLRLQDIEGMERIQRYNVAVSRARDQIWVVNSIDTSRDLKEKDIRKDLIDYADNPKAFSQRMEQVMRKSDSPFEEEVAKFLVIKGYNIVQQWEVGSYKIDIVAIYENNKIAIECDGEAFHSTAEQVKRDMERQSILERLGWTFIRIRGSEYYRDKEKTLQRVIDELSLHKIKPEQVHSSYDYDVSLLDKIKVRVKQIQSDWRESIEVNADDEYKDTSIQLSLL